jgi:hypothetical protein
MNIGRITKVVQCVIAVSDKLLETPIVVEFNELICIEADGRLSF